MRVYLVKVVVLASLVFLLSISQGFSEEDELVGHWSFDKGKGDALADSSDYKNNGKIYNCTWTKGVTGNALQFDGDKTYVELKRAQSLALTDKLTISCWVKFSEKKPVSNYPMIIYSGRDGSSMYSLGTQGSKVTFKSVNTKTKWQNAATHELSWKPGEWYHIAVTYDVDAGKDNMKIYVNGKLDNVATYKYPIRNYIWGFYFGCPGSWKYGGSFAGTLDEVKIYKMALSEEEIEEEYNRVLKASGLTLIAPARVVKKDFSYLSYRKWDADKKIIGFTKAGPKYIHDNIDFIETLPLNGIVIYFPGLASPGLVYGKNLIKDEDFAEDVRYLKETDFQRFTDNFFFVHTVCNTDWFDDWTNIIENFRLTAKIAKETGCKGVFLDNETYTGNTCFFAYSCPSHPHNKELGPYKAKYADEKTWEEYKEQAVKRGCEVMTAMREVFPEIRVWVHASQSTTYFYERMGIDLSKFRYGLVSAYMDGFLKGMEGDNVYINGHVAYGAGEGKYRWLPKYIKEEAIAISYFPEKYAKYTSVSFPLWIDMPNYPKGEILPSRTDFSRNKYTPDDVKKCLKVALESCDEYVWIWIGDLFEFLVPGGIPKEYIEAVEYNFKGIDRKVDKSKKVVKKKKTQARKIYFNQANLDSYGFTFRGPRPKIDNDILRFKTSAGTLSLGTLPDAFGDERYIIIETRVRALKGKDPIPYPKYEDSDTCFFIGSAASGCQICFEIGPKRVYFFSAEPRVELTDKLKTPPAQFHDYKFILDQKKGRCTILIDGVEVVKDTPVMRRAFAESTISFGDWTQGSKTEALSEWQYIKISAVTAQVGTKAQPARADARCRPGSTKGTK